MPCDESLHPVVDGCKDAAAQLRNALDRAGKLKGRHLWSHIREAVVVVWNEKQIDAMEKRLERLRDEIGQRLQVIIK